MRVRVVENHASPIGPKKAKRKGDEFTARAEDADAYIAAGLLAEVQPKAPAKDK